MLNSKKKKLSDALAALHLRPDLPEAQARALMGKWTWRPFGVQDNEPLSQCLPSANHHPAVCGHEFLSLLNPFTLLT